MERIQPRRKTGMTAAGLRMFGLLFVVLGVAGKGVIQNQILGLGEITSQGLLELLESSPDMMSYATAGIVLEALETCAVPIFAFLLVEGMSHTSDFKKYFFRVLGLAALSEIPYNMAFSGKLLDFSSRNPVFGLVLSMAVIYLWRTLEGKSFKNKLVKALLVLCGVVWTVMLNVEYGNIVVILVTVLWIFREKTSLRNMIGAAVTILCGMTSMFFMAAPMGFLAVFLYNGEQGEQNRYVSYLAYPVILVAVTVIGMVAL